MKLVKAHIYQIKHRTMSKKYTIASRSSRNEKKIAYVETHFRELTPNPIYKQLLSKGVSLHCYKVHVNVPVNSSGRECMQKNLTSACFCIYLITAFIQASSIDLLE